MHVQIYKSVHMQVFSKCNCVQVHIPDFHIEATLIACLHACVKTRQFKRTERKKSFTSVKPFKTSQLRLIAYSTYYLIMITKVPAISNDLDSSIHRIDITVVHNPV